MQNVMRKSWTEGPVATFLSASLKGISQVLLIENAFSGLLILLAITTSSLLLGIMTILSAFIGNIIGKIGGADENSINQGLFGYNSVLTGIALTLFLTGPYHWIIALIGAAIAAIFTAAMMHVMKSSGIPVLTIPFIVLSWLMLLASYRLKAFQLTPDLVPQDLSNWEVDMTGKADWVEGTFNGIGQIFFLHNTLSGVLLFVAVFWAGWKFGLYAIIGNFVALITSYLLGGEPHLIFMGLYGYNAILTIFAVSVVFKGKSHRFGPYLGIIGACLTVLLTASIATLLLPFGLPALTMPFVLSTWLLLAARKVLPRL
ncbi:urea transporter [Sporosarcina sp. YIM B06819]|uniref:urea transporter n=1 Tax=Sporosarcina sp. YIM B06819 TaxID=3081769 RepID=UPI00298C5072|nr:urea transporter [Sporosarcina sp. YIM B06819]